MLLRMRWSGSSWKCGVVGRRCNAGKDCSVTQRFQREGAIETHDKVEVKVGLGSTIVEQSDLDDLIEAPTEMRNLAADGKAAMDIGSA
jgi:hypothetical protein